MPCRWRSRAFPIRREATVHELLICHGDEKAIRWNCRAGWRRIRPSSSIAVEGYVDVGRRIIWKIMDLPMFWTEEGRGRRIVGLCLVRGDIGAMRATIVDADAANWSFHAMAMTMTVPSEGPLHWYNKQSIRQSQEKVEGSIVVSRVVRAFHCIGKTREMKRIERRIGLNAWLNNGNGDDDVSYCWGSTLWFPARRCGFHETRDLEQHAHFHTSHFKINPFFI